MVSLHTISINKSQWIVNFGKLTNLEILANQRSILQSIYMSIHYKQKTKPPRLGRDGQANQTPPAAMGHKDHELGTLVLRKKCTSRRLFAIPGIRFAWVAVKIGLHGPVFARGLRLQTESRKWRRRQERSAELIWNHMKPVFTYISIIHNYTILYPNGSKWGVDNAQVVTLCYEGRVPDS